MTTIYLFITLKIASVIDSVYLPMHQMYLVQLNFDLEQIATKFILMACDYVSIYITYKKYTKI